MRTGIELIAEERQEQIEKHGRTTYLDVRYNDGQQLRLAAKKLLVKWDGLEDGNLSRNEPPQGWDENIWKKMISKDYKERLIIAGALIAAELDRINNLSVKD